MQRFVLSVAALAFSVAASTAGVCAAQEEDEDEVQAMPARLVLASAARPALVGPMVERLQALGGSGLVLDQTQRRRLDSARAAAQRTADAPTSSQLRAAVFRSVDVAVRGVLPLALRPTAAGRLRALAPIRDRAAVDAARTRVTRIRGRVSNRRVRAACDQVVALATLALARMTSEDAAQNTARGAGSALADVVAATVAAGAPAQAALDTVLGTDTVVTGSISKGPFVAGSSVTVVALDDHGVAIAAARRTVTTNDRGEYTLELPHHGLVSIEAHGRAYDELTGQVSRGALRLRALARTSDGAGTMNANVVTDACYERTLHLLSEGSEFSAAVAQAERELFTGFALGTSGAAGRRMRVDRDPELLTSSATVIEAANAAGITVQSLMDHLARDLADDGIVEPRLQDLLHRAYDSVDVTEVRARFDARFGDTSRHEAR